MMTVEMDLMREIVVSSVLVILLAASAAVHHQMQVHYMGQCNNLSFFKLLYVIISTKMSYWQSSFVKKGKTNSLNCIIIYTN